MNQQQAPSVARIVRPSRATIQWNDSLDVALAHMNATFHDELFVLAEIGSLVAFFAPISSVCARKAIGPAVLLSWTPWIALSRGARWT